MKRHGLRAALLGVLLVLAAAPFGATACGRGPAAQGPEGEGGPGGRGKVSEKVSERTGPVPPGGDGADPAEAGMASSYASDYGVPVAEAVRRLELQDDVGRLGAALEKNESETFADLETQHEPEYRVVAYFTRGGERTIRPYVRGTPLEGMVEVEGVQATSGELAAAQAEAHRVADRLDIPASSGVNVTKNRVELYVPDLPGFQSALRGSGEELPDNVAVIGPRRPPRPPGGSDPRGSSSDPEVFFPRQAFGGEGGMMALTEGRLTLDGEGCLRIETPGYAPVPVWPADFGLDTGDDGVRVLDREGRLVGRVGQKISLGGGGIPKGTLEGNDLLDKRTLDELLERCPGGYWLVTAE